MLARRWLVTSPPYCAWRSSRIQRLTLPLSVWYLSRSFFVSSSTNLISTSPYRKSCTVSTTKINSPSSARCRRPVTECLANSRLSMYVTLRLRLAPKWKSLIFSSNDFLVSVIGVVTNTIPPCWQSRTATSIPILVFPRLVYAAYKQRRYWTRRSKISSISSSCLKRQIIGSLVSKNISRPRYCLTISVKIPRWFSLL